MYRVDSEVGALREVILHRPGLELKRLTPGNKDRLLFDDVLWVQNAQRDHFDFIAKMRERGVEVVEVIDGSPAARAGVRAEDLIVGVDGVPVRGVDDLQRLMTEERIGVSCALEVVREGVARAVALVPQELVTA